MPSISWRIVCVLLLVLTATFLVPNSVSAQQPYNLNAEEYGLPSASPWQFSETELWHVLTEPAWTPPYKTFQAETDSAYCGMITKTLRLANVLPWIKWFADYVHADQYVELAFSFSSCSDQTFDIDVFTHDIYIFSGPKPQVPLTVMGRNPNSFLAQPFLYDIQVDDHLFLLADQNPTDFKVPVVINVSPASDTVTKPGPSEQPKWYKNDLGGLHVELYMEPTGTPSQRWLNLYFLASVPTPTPTLTPPNLVVNNPTTDCPSRKVTVSGQATPTTPGATITRIHVDWGDNNAEDIPVLNPFSASHAYANDGTYTITVTAYDSNGLSAAGTRVVTIACASPANLNVAIVFIRTYGTMGYINKLGDWKQLSKTVSDFYYAQSNGKLTMNFLFYPVENQNKADNEQIQSYYYGRNQQDWEKLTPQDLLPDFIELVSKDIDFRMFDYDPVKGKGIVVFVVLDRDVSEQADGLFFRPDDGGQYNAQGTSFDLIFVDGSGVGTTWSIAARTVAHELGHWVSDLLTDGSKYGTAALPDLYKEKCPLFKGNYYMDIMRVRDGVGWFGAFNREWLGWNQFRDLELSVNPTQFELKALWKLQMGQEIPRLKISDDEWLIFDLRTRHDTAGTSSNEKAVLYIHSVKKFYCARSSSDDVMISPADQTPIFSDSTFPIATYNYLYSIKVSIVNVQEGVDGIESATIAIEQFHQENLKGAVLETASMLIGEGAAGGQSITFDLHAYTSDGRHIGMNYEKNEYENQVEGALSSGSKEGMQWILVPSNLEMVFVVIARPSSANLNVNTEIALRAILYDAGGKMQTSQITYLQTALKDLGNERFVVEVQGNKASVRYSSCEITLYEGAKGLGALCLQRRTVIYLALLAVASVLIFYVFRRGSARKKPAILEVIERPRIESSIS